MKIQLLVPNVVTNFSVSEVRIAWENRVCAGFVVLRAPINVNGE
jgi:hypothetical protein